jgi:hypothetical protein
VNNYVAGTELLPEPGPAIKDWTSYRMAFQVVIIFGWGVSEGKAKRKFTLRPTIIRFDNRKQEEKCETLLDNVSEIQWLGQFRLEPAISFWTQIAGEFGLEMLTTQIQTLPNFPDYKGMEFRYLYHKSAAVHIGLLSM